MDRNVQDREDVIGQLARSLTRLGLVDVALLALDGLSPLGPVAAQLVWVAQPALSAVVDTRTLDGLAALLEEPAGVAALRAGLEAARAPRLGAGG